MFANRVGFGKAWGVCAIPAEVLDCSRLNNLNVLEVSVVSVVSRRLEDHLKACDWVSDVPRDEVGFTLAALKGNVVV